MAPQFTRAPCAGMCGAQVGLCSDGWCARAHHGDVWGVGHAVPNANGEAHPQPSHREANRCSLAPQSPSNTSACCQTAQNGAGGGGLPGSTPPVDLENPDPVCGTRWGARAALEASISYSAERKQFGKSIDQFQVTQFKLADMATELEASRLMVLRAASSLDAKDSQATKLCAMAKRFTTDICSNICDMGLQIHGGYGYLKDFPLERLVRDLRVHQILEGTNEIMRVIISRKLKGN